MVSTRAGSLGINLVGANRVIVFDASWNPCHDTQAVCRVYRYGQKKPCFVYRLVMDNCLEKKIYDRQINKQGMADRVVDECNPDAHLSLREVTSLCWDDGEDPEIQDFSPMKDKYIDLVTHFLLEKHSQCLTKAPFQHESLLVDRKEKKLSMAEKRMAKRGYELEKQAASKPPYSYNPSGTTYRAYRNVDGSIVHRPVASVNIRFISIVTIMII
jgi:RAD54-like protein 2